MRRLCHGLLLIALGACDADEPCDEGFTYEQGSCVLDAPGTPDAGGSGSGGDDAGGSANDAGTNPDEDGGESACSEALDAILGTDCTADDECNCAAPFCAIMPGQPMGTCTVYCNPDPDDCPDGYRCFDLSALGVEGYEPFCTEDT
jgi:hypothetical protein